MLGVCIPIAGAVCVQLCVCSNYKYISAFTVTDYFKVAQTVIGTKLLDNECLENCDDRSKDQHFRFPFLMYLI